MKPGLLLRVKPQQLKFPTQILEVDNGSSCSEGLPDGAAREPC